VSFWSDGAAKSRWVSVPKAKTIGFSPTGEWVFPQGTVFVKHFDITTNEMHPSEKRRLETRLLVCDATGGVYGVTYKWRADRSDAELLATNLTEEIVIATASGLRTQNWYYPAAPIAGPATRPMPEESLGVKTRQINREYNYGEAKENQLRAWNRLGLFERALKDEEIDSCAKLARLDDANASLEERARSYLDANCSQCHRPGGAVAYFDADLIRP